jgi:hypothetical protein
VGVLAALALALLALVLVLVCRLCARWLLRLRQRSGYGAQLHAARGNHLRWRTVPLALVEQLEAYLPAAAEQLVDGRAALSGACAAAAAKERGAGGRAGGRRRLLAHVCGGGWSSVRLCALRTQCGTATSKTTTFSGSATPSTQRSR